MGGNVFAGKTASIKVENISPTLDVYFSELQTLFPNKADIFNPQHFIALGSVGKKRISSDIDLGVDSVDLIDKKMSDDSIAEWGIDPKAVAKEFELLERRARTATAEHLRMKAFLKMLTVHINTHAPVLFCDEKKVSNGNVFGLYPQFNEARQQLDIGVQIDWMIGELPWLKFSYYSTAYPEGSNVKGLHRTQLMLSAFQVANLSFNHVSGVKHKASGKIVAHDPDRALTILGESLGFNITQADAENYYSLHTLLKENMKPDYYNAVVNTYLKILDSTRADIPDNLQAEWYKRRDNLGLTGKFLPESSLLKV